MPRFLQRATLVLGGLRDDIVVAAASRTGRASASAAMPNETFVGDLHAERHDAARREAERQDEALALGRSLQ